MSPPDSYPSFRDLRAEIGPFDIIGDVHGCADELTGLLARLGYRVRLDGSGNARRATVESPHGRRVIFVGDLVDRGPNAPDVLRIATQIAANGLGFTVIGNHDAKFGRWLQGRSVKLTHGLDRTVEQFSREPDAFKVTILDFLTELPPYLWLDQGRLAVAHAGLKEDMIGAISNEIRRFCLYGETSGATDEFGLPIRYNWAAAYTGQTSIVYGHTPVPDAEWQNNTLCLDTGCCFGGKLTALRWPEREVVSIPAAKTYTVPVRPFGHPPSRPATNP